MLSPVGARAVTSWETEQLSRVSGCCPPQGRELLPKDFKFAIDDIVAVPRRGASCYRKDSDLDPLEELLSPVGARAVTAISDMKIWFARSCCPPQGRELLHPSSATALCSISLLSPAGARDVTVTGSYYTGGSTLLSPAGARSVTITSECIFSQTRVAVPRRGASCYEIEYILY